jgi:antitoxin VapB
MAIYLKDPEVDRLARELAQRERVSITEAVERALKERIGRLAAEREEKYRRTLQLIEEIRALPVYDDRPLEEMLYDEDGNPK